MGSFETLLVKNIDHVSIITLNRPKVHNAFNSVMIEELTSAFNNLATDDSTRVIVLTGTGRSFSAGADINALRISKDFTYEENLEDASRLEHLFNTIYITPKPVVAKVNGAAFGGGLGLISACDIAIAIASAKFSFSEVNLGIIPAVISTYVVPKIGLSNANRYFLTGERFDAKKAKEIGLVHEIVSEISELEQILADIIDQLLSSSPTAMSQIKKLLITHRGTDLQTVRQYCIDEIAKLRISPDGKEGLSAFLEKRSANWKLAPWKGRTNTKGSK